MHSWTRCGNLPSDPDEHESEGERKMVMEKLKYPIGRFDAEGEITEKQRESWITDIADLPSELASALEGLDDRQLDTPYRPEGWTVRQVAFHIGDSHLNSFARFKLALTEEQPTIRPYDEGAWADLPDTFKAPIELSVDFATALHARWVFLLRGMREADFARTFLHPASQSVSRLDYALGMYAWHGRHHVAHITSLRERMGWL